MKKLGMDEKDFTLERSELYIKESLSVADGGNNLDHSSDPSANDVVVLRPAAGSEVSLAIQPTV